MHAVVERVAHIVQQVGFTGVAQGQAMGEQREGRRIEVHGTVQGVGFRPWVYRLACEEGIAGRVRNDPEGVTIEAFGQGAALESFLRKLRLSPPGAASISDLETAVIPAEPARGFSIVESRGAGRRRVSIPPDLAVCPDCLREVFDPADRRYRYPFTNCTNCGPRFTIAREVPYDRARTSMAAFEMCSRCRAEYEDPADRRFHAQPNACPACGPRLRLVDAAGREPPGDPLTLAAAWLGQGRIVAVKGLGGFHLACDAGSGPAVARLRERKQRDEKPFAVMVGDLQAAHALAALSAEEARLLASVERPVVLVARRPTAPLAAGVAPGNPLVGLLLAYTPLHHLLLAEAGRPLVMTSANLSDEPMLHRDAEARERLRGIADALLLHDRAIESRCDDSVARVVAGSPVVLRRGRGYVPRSVALARPLQRPVLACGAHLKNAFCLAAGDRAWLGPHVGDLETLEACRAFEESVARLEDFLGIRPELVAHDLHPDYFTTVYAQRRGGAPTFGVQHHHAHVVSAMAEHGLRGPVIGVAYDGTGYGSDGTAWGGELLLARVQGFERLATFRPVGLAGGDQAIREVWRIALALLRDAFGDDAPVKRLALFRGIPARQLEVVARSLAKGAPNVPLARGVGRYFDALGALGLNRPRASYEGQVALEWNLAADPLESRCYPFEIGSQPLPELDLRPLVRAAVRDLLDGRPAGLVSARFHNSLARATGELVRRAVERVGALPVVLTGGCFQNARLAEGVLAELGKELPVYTHGEVPPGDGGIALGQALVADAVAAGAA